MCSAIVLVLNKAGGWGITITLGVAVTGHVNPTRVSLVRDSGLVRWRVVRHVGSMGALSTWHVVLCRSVGA
eukprot:3540222-Pyramimonas_sp.AAC.1